MIKKFLLLPMTLMTISINIVYAQEDNVDIETINKQPLYYDGSNWQTSDGAQIQHPFPKPQQQDLQSIGKDDDISRLPATTQVKKSSIFKFAWEMPLYKDTYEYVGRTFWIEPRNTFEVMTQYVLKRQVDDVDATSYLGYISLRPFAFDFGSFSIVTGFSYVGDFLNIESATRVSPRLISATNFAIISKGVTTEFLLSSINISNLVSIPKYSMQIIMDIGYAFGDLQTDIDSLVVDGIEAPIRLTYEDYTYKQRDEMLFFGLGVTKSFDRNYLNLFQLLIFGGANLKTPTRESKGTLRFTNKRLIDIPGEPATLRFGEQDLPYTNGPITFPDIQQASKMNLNFVDCAFISRLYTYYTPLNKDRGISVAWYGAVSHISGELGGRNLHGMRMKTGGILTLFDAISLRGAYVWENNNDLEGGWEFRITVRLMGILRKLAESI